MTLLEAALERSEEEREAYLREACQQDDSLFKQVWTRVQWDARMGGFLKEPLLPGEPPDHPFDAGEILAGRFLILREVARGGMGLVYEALDQKLDKRVAIKCAKAGFGRRLPPEVRSAREITHYNVCK